MTKKVDDGFTGRVLMALATAIADRNYKDAKVHVQTLAKEHGVGAYAERVFGISVKRNIARRANLPQGDGHRVWQRSSRARATLFLPMLAVSASATF